MAAPSFTPLHTQRVAHGCVTAFFGLMVLMYPAWGEPDYDGALFSRSEDPGFVWLVASAFLGAHATAELLRRRSLVNIAWLLAALALVAERMVALILFQPDLAGYSISSCSAVGISGDPICRAAMLFIEYRMELILLAACILVLKLFIGLVQYMRYWNHVRRQENTADGSHSQ